MKKECKCIRRTRHIPYGAKRKLFWCWKCDANLTIPVKKTAERMKAKKEILDSMGS